MINSLIHCRVKTGFLRRTEKHAKERHIVEVYNFVDSVFRIVVLRGKLPLICLNYWSVDLKWFVV